MLTDSQIKKIKPPVGKTAPDKYSDGNNLYLHVFASGGKRWIMDYRFEGKRKAFSVGTPLKKCVYRRFIWTCQSIEYTN